MRKSWWGNNLSTLSLKQHSGGISDIWGRQWDPAKKWIGKPRSPGPALWSFRAMTSAALCLLSGLWMLSSGVLWSRLCFSVLSSGTPPFFCALWSLTQPQYLISNDLQSVSIFTGKWGTCANCYFLFFSFFLSPHPHPATEGQGLQVVWNKPEA